MTQQSLKKNVVLNGILTMSSFLFPLISFPYVSRILLPEGMGKVSFATSLVAYFLIFAQLGIPTYGVRVCARIRDNRQALTRTVQELLIIQLVMSGIAYAVLLLASVFVPRMQEERILYLVIGSSILFQSIGMEWLYKALEQYAYITVRSVICKLIALGALFALVHTREDYVIYGGITIFAASASNICNFLHARRYISLKPVGGYRFGPHLRATAVFFAMACATTVYTHLDTVMLGFLDSDAAVGYYNAATRIKSILVSLITSLGVVLLPRCSYYVEHGQLTAFWKVSHKAIRFVFLAASPLTVYLILFADQGIRFLSGDAYGGAVMPMQIVMPTLLLIGLSNILGIQILVPLGRERVVLWSEITGAAVDMICNLILIPRYGATGAAVSCLAAEAVVLLVQAFALRDAVIPAFQAVPCRTILLSLGLGAAASLWTTGLQASAFWSLVVSAGLFFGVYGFVLVLTGESLVLEILMPIRNKIRHIFSKEQEEL